MKIEFKNSIRTLSFLCRLPDIKISWINPGYLSDRAWGVDVRNEDLGEVIIKWSI